MAVRAPWHDTQSVKVKMTIDAKGEDGEAKTVVKTFDGQSPARGGVPDGWRRYQSVVLRETVGVARASEPVEFTLAARAENCGDLARELRMYAFDPARQTHRHAENHPKSGRLRHPGC